MSDSRLLIAMAVFDFLAGLKKGEQRNPSHYVDFVERDANGRNIGVHIYGKEVRRLAGIGR